MKLTRAGVSAWMVALAAAHPAAKLDARDCGGNCIVAPVEAPGPKPEVYLEAVVWVNKAGEPICTITETVTAKPSPPPPPPPPPVKIVVPYPQENTTTTVLTSASTTTVFVVPAAPTAPPPKVKAVVECNEGCGEAPVPEEGGCEGGCGDVKVPVPPAPDCEGGCGDVPAPAPVAPEKVSCEGGCGDVPVPVVHEEAECEGGCGKAPKAQPKPAPKPGHKDSPAPPVSGKSLHGISYAAYRGDHGCKSKEDIDDDFDQMKGLYSVVRTYGVDCNQVEIIYEAAKRIGVKVFYGIWDLNAVQEEASKIAAGINGDWDIVDSISVGNELVNNGEASAEQVIAAVKQAREVLRSAGYQGPVVAVDTFIATEAHPELCEESDYCAINAHAYFDSTISADQAGPWLEKTVKSIQSKLSANKKIIVTETGWPTQGAANGLAIPSIENQKLALDSISKSFADSPGNIILFSAFNDLWKGDRDKYWGIGGAVSRCDQ